MRVTWALLALIAVFPAATRAGTAEKVLIGAVESVVLLPWGIRVPARIDTGAATSSIDTCEIKIEGEEVRFTLADRCGGLALRLPLADVRHVQSAEQGEERPVVEIELCLGPRRLRTQVTLNDRSRLEYPLLVGRNTLAGEFVVDVSRSEIAPPHCPPGPEPGEGRP
jgi:hypothetical protein